MNKKAKSKEIWIILIVLLIILLLSGLVYLLRLSFSQSYNYQGKNGKYEITKSTVGLVDFYQITVSSDNLKYIYSFRNHPKDLEDIYLESGLLPKLNRPQGIKYLFVTQDMELSNMTQSDSVLAINSFEQVLTGSSSVYNLKLFNTYTTQVRSNLPAITCANVSNQYAVVYLKVGDESKIYSQGDCIIIQGRGGNGLIRASEKFAYSLLGVF